MKHKYLFAALFILSSFITSRAQIDRFSSNPIPKLNVLGVALSENVESANKMFNEFFKEKMRLDLQFNYVIDPTYKKLKDQKAVDISFFGKSASGKKFESKLDTELELNANLNTLLILDRSKKVRAFSQVATVDFDEMGRIVEELLLNLDGKELISVDSEKPDEAIGWQTDLGKENSEKEKKGIVIDFGASENYWYKFLGKELPNVDLVKNDGTATSLHESLNNQVSVVLIFVASSEEEMQYFTGGTAFMMNLAKELYESFTLQKAEPGDEFMKNAVPDNPSSQK
ncbi:MAG: hypothetical protein WC061_00245 [Melioribacteraceae bacterium]